MNSEGEKGVDELFKKGLENPPERIAYQESDWNNLENMLNQHTGGWKIVNLLPLLAGVAALLLLVLGWWFLKPLKPKINQQFTSVQQPVNQHQTEAGSGHPPTTSGATAVNQPGATALATNPASTGSQASTGLGSTNHASTGPGPATMASIKPGSTSPASAKPGVSQQQPKSQALAGVVGPVLAASSGSRRSKYAPKETPGTIEASSVQTGSGETRSAGDALAVLDAGAKYSAAISGSENSLTANLPAPKAAAIVPAASVSSKNKPTKLSGSKGRPQFAITLLGSPNVNGVGSFSGSKAGANAGLMFSMEFGKKFRVSTGAWYAKAPYDASYDKSYSSYYYKTPPVNVSANCRVLDIPINVDYRVYSKNKNSFTVGTGLSSYFMLNETYHYNFTTPPAYAPADIVIVNQNKHIMGVLNLDVAYQRKLNSRLSLDVEPYMKVPLTKIGYYQVKLQSAGVAVGLSWSISAKH